MSIATSCTSCALHNLPVGLFATILEKYLDVTDWSKLDIAFCSSRNEMRSLFLEALKSVKLKIINSFINWTPRIKNGLQKWITARGIRIVSWEEYNLNDNRLIEIVNTNNYITSLDLSHCKDISDAGITAVAFWLNSNLKELNLTCCKNLTDSSILAISMGAKNLESLDLLFCEGITDKALEAIGSSLPKLHKLRMPWESSATGIGYIANGCLQNLYELDLCSSKNVSDEGVNTIAKGNLHNLQKLNISNYSICSDLTLKVLANGNLSQLTELSIGLTMNVTDEGVSYLASGNLKNLKTLSINGAISGSGIATIACGMPTLVSLSVSSDEMITKAEGLNAIFTNLVNLQELYITECDATDAGFAPLARSEVICGEIKYALSSLSIRSSYIADIGLMIIVKGLSNLKELVIYHSEVTDFGLTAVGSSGLQLESLNLDVCRNITEKGIIYVMTKLPTLKSLEISHPNFDDNIACAIAKSCGSSSVGILDISLNDMTDIGLMALVYGLRNLTRLDIFYDEQVFSDKVIDIINENFPNLLTLH